MTQSTIFPIFIRSEYKDGGAGFRRFQSDAQQAAQAAKREFQGVSAALDQALSRPRNAGGSLDLGVDEMRRALVVQQQVAAAAREVAEATKRAATANGQFDAALSRATRSAFELAKAEERASAELLQQVTALERVQQELNGVASSTALVTRANRGAVASQGALRTASVQAGQQLQDIVVQLESGTRATTIFAQQVPQLAFALTGLRDSTSAVQRRIGGLATFLAGPWGAAVFAGTAILGPFVAKLFEAEKAADEVRFSTDALGNAQSVLGNVLDITTGKIDTQSEALRNLAAAQLLANQIENARKQTELRGALGEAAREQGEKITGPLGLPIPNVRPGPGIGRLDGFLRRPSESAAVVRGFLDGDTGASQAIDQLRALEKAGAITQERLLDLSATIANLGVEQRNSEIFAAADRLLNGNATAADRGILLKPDRATPRRTRGGAGSEARELKQLADFGEKAQESILRINERFDEQPRLIDQAAQATRQLDDIIKDLSKRKPVGFEKLIEEAERAKSSVESALLRPFEALRQESEQRLQIETLLAAGREDEARTLQEVLRLEQQIGAVSAEQRAEIEEIVRAERLRTRELRDQAALFAAQLGVVDEVRRSLTDVLSGRGGDFFGNFRQALRDLQGQRLFETIFGDTFRQIEEELRGKSPQGRANARYAAEVERTALTTARVERALDSLAESAESASVRLRGGVVAANDNAGGFNPQVNIVQAALQAAGIGTGITVTGTRPRTTEIGRMSIDSLAKRISGGIGTSIGAQLDDLLGPRFAALLGDVVGGAIAGKVLGGTTGSILGGLEGLTANVKGLEGLSGLLGKAGTGAATGTQIAGLSKLLGLGGSTTGAQIGGAAGAFLPFPGGDIVGAIAGNIIGGLLKSTKRGSATIGGAGGSLGVTGIRGNSSSLKDTANTLAGSVLESVTRIAEQLGAEVNASAGRVSIGQRDKNLRVDTTGRGITKTRNGAVDFGDDAEAAIAFAVRDLIQDGVIKGLKASENRLLQAASDVETGLRDVLTFRSVFDRLKEIRDPIGFAVDQVTKEFDRFREVFRRAGADAAELADLEALASLERAQAIEDATSRVVGSLRGLLDNLRTGDSGLSIRTRRGNALGEFDALAARVAAGDSSAFDRFAEVSQQLLDIERQLFGSTQSYFDRLGQVTSLTEQAIAGQANVVSIGAAGIAPMDDSIAVVRSIDVQTDTIALRLDTLNANFVALATRLEQVSGGGGFQSDLPLTPRQISNF